MVSPGRGPPGQKAPCAPHRGLSHQALGRLRTEISSSGAFCHPSPAGQRHWGSACSPASRADSFARAAPSSAVGRSPEGDELEPGWIARSPAVPRNLAKYSQGFPRQRPSRDAPIRNPEYIGQVTEAECKSLGAVGRCLLEGRSRCRRIKSLRTTLKPQRLCRKEAATWKTITDCF